MSFMHLQRRPALVIPSHSLSRRALNDPGKDSAEREADRIADSVAHAVQPAGTVEPAASGGAASGERLEPALRTRLEAFLGWDLSTIRIHSDDEAGSSARALGARAFTSGRDIFFGPRSPRLGTQAGLGLLGHELAHAHQQSAGKAPWATVQKKEDWDFTPADFKALHEHKKELRFAEDSNWLPKELQDNLLQTLKFTLTSTKPVRTAGINVKDFYHGHFCVPKGKMTSGLSTEVSEFEAKSQELQGKALGGKWYNPVTKENLPEFTKAMQRTEKMATPMLQDALKAPGAAVFYHTFEGGGPKMEAGSATRNIRTPIGGSPAGYDPSGTGESANRFRADYAEILQFAFLVDEDGVIHVTVGTVPNLSRVTGTPMQ